MCPSRFRRRSGCAFRQRARGSSPALWSRVPVAGRPAGSPGGGTVQRCDVTVGACQVVASGRPLPSVITFDKWGDLWLLESNIIAPTVWVLPLP